MVIRSELFSENLGGESSLTKMALDDSTINDNRAAAIASVRDQLGLSSDPSSWSYDERVNYNKALAGYIAAHPNDFNATDAATAGIVGAADTPTQLLDTSFDWSAFGTEVWNQAASINDSVNPFSPANRGKLLWIAVAIGALYLLLPRILESVGRGKKA
jgi:hypothetical protein